MTKPPLNLNELTRDWLGELNIAWESFEYLLTLTPRQYSNLRRYCAHKGIHIKDEILTRLCLAGCLEHFRRVEEEESAHQTLEQLTP